MTASTVEREETVVRDLFARVDEVLDVADLADREDPVEAFSAAAGAVQMRSGGHPAQHQ